MPLGEFKSRFSVTHTTYPPEPNSLLQHSQLFTPQSSCRHTCIAVRPHQRLLTCCFAFRSLPNILGCENLAGLSVSITFSRRCDRERNISNCSLGGNTLTNYRLPFIPARSIFPNTRHFPQLHPLAPVSPPSLTPSLSIHALVSLSSDLHIDYPQGRVLPFP
ncbi:hypothetical protein EV356DRAFT_43004 [Viridothelium virens]|uniref:Uncharacterized protein n=1 Tax=Viridothelium virens TaxID=1048519 RepID=A0A6A6HGJ8_VIRVR|nr:hypothetical protein EV356DRAFT_43004 [Viridothelium virens]